MHLVAFAATFTPYRFLQSFRVCTVDIVRIFLFFHDFTFVGLRENKAQ